MLQSGGIIEDAKVGELVNLVAGLHKRPDAGRARRSSGPGSPTWRTGR